MPILKRNILYWLLYAYGYQQLFFCVLSFVLNLTQDVCTVITIVLIATAAIVLTSSNVIIYKIAKRHDQFLEKNSPRRKDMKQTGKVLKASYVCFAIVSTFILLWFPFLIHNSLDIIGLYRPSHVKPFTNVIVHLALLNSIVDVLLYVWLSREAKKELIGVFRTTFKGSKDRNRSIRRSMYKYSCTSSGQRIDITSL